MSSKIIAFLLMALFSGMKSSFSQDTLSSKYTKSITAGVTSVITNPFFLNALADAGFRMYNSRANIGFGINSKLLVRFKLDNFIVSLTDIKAYKKINRNGKFPIDIGLSMGFGINSSPEGKFLLTSTFVSVPVWKLQLECQSTLAIPSLKSSFINLNIAYYFKIKNDNFVQTKKLEIIK